MTESVESVVSVRQTRKTVHLLLGILSLCLVLVAVLVVILVVIVTEPKACTTYSCVSLAASILAPMNLSADPCQDFYNYACGNWNKTVVIPAGIPRWTTFGEVQVRNDKLLEQAVTSAGTTYMGEYSESLHKAKLYYAACMNITRIDARDSQPLLQYISELGSSHMLNSIRELPDWDPSSWRLVNILGKSHKFNGKALFVVYANPDYKTDVNELWFYQSGLSLYNTAEFYLNNKSDFYHDELLRFAEKILQRLGTREDVRPYLEEIWRFETELAKIFDPPEASQNKSARYNKMSLTEFTTLTNGIFDMREYFRKLLGSPLDPTDQIIVSSLDYFRQLAALVQSTDDRILANYIMFRIILKNTRYLSTAFHEIRREFVTTVLGDSSEPDRVKDCLGQLNSYLTDVVSAMYIEANVVDASLKEESERLVADITRTFDGRIDSSDWMDGPTKSKAHQKVALLHHLVGYPEIVEHPRQLDEKYDKFHFTEDYFENVRGAVEVRRATGLANRGRSLQAEWPSGAHRVNAFYHPVFNTMLFPAGILNPPFYSNHYPMAMNYGGIGTVIGHELTHGFDVNGRQLDGHGKLINWWSEESEVAFRQKAQCMIDQYDAFVVGSSHVNGQLTLGENMADNGGMKTAYDAYLARVRTNGDHTPHLPGLDLTNEQLYFVGFAESRCDYITPQYAEISLATDDHTHPKYRIIGPVQNSQEFAEAFQCPAGSPMNPSNKCVIW